MRRDFCNPMNLSYKYQHLNNQASREAADPTLIYFKGKYYMFASMSGGFFYSDDLIEWKWHENRNLELYKYAPDVRQIGEYLVFSASSRGKGVMYRTLDPFSEKYEKVCETFSFWDPNTFQDDDGRVYFYWGCDNGKPIYGIELDPEKLTPVGKKKPLIFGRQTEFGWERPNYPGRENDEQDTPLATKLFHIMMALSGRSPDRPYIEGAFMNKWNGKYYLQYAAPGTEIATYGDGVYVSDNPLGPFSVQKHNPFSSRPSGFITGAGHGSTIEDAHGNFWHAATNRVSINANFERRIGLFPAGFDKDGVLFCNQRFADYPVDIPEGKFDPWDVKPKWMLLSYKKPCNASSFISGHEPKLAADEDIRSCWCAHHSRDEWFQMDLEQAYPVHAVQINFADVDVPMLQRDKAELSNFETGRRYIDTDHSLKTRYLLEGSLDGQQWFVLADKREADTDLPHDYLRFDGVLVRYLRITAVQLPYDKKFALSGLRVFGLGNGPKPDIVKNVSAVFSDPMTAQLRWDPVDGAVGYEVQYGISPDKLYSSYLVYEKPEVLLTTLNVNQEYYVRIDSFNENGVTEGTVQSIR